MLKLALIHELANILLIGIHIEGVSLEDNKSHPSPCKTKHRFIEGALF